MSMNKATIIKNSRLRARYGPCAVVTGASDGIGKAFADLLAEHGFDLVLAARRNDVLETLAAGYRQKYGIACDVRACDLGQPEAVSAIAELASSRDIGLLVAAAGFGSSGDFAKSELAEELAMIDLNCRSVAALSHAFGRSFVARKRGGIVLLSSLLAFQGVPGAANYAATKAYVQSFAEGIRRELAPHGVDVLAVAPGPIDSGFAQRANMTYGMSQGPGVVASQAMSALGRKATLRPGYLAKFLEGALSPLPRSGRVRILQQIMGGMANANRPGAK